MAEEIKEDFTPKQVQEPATAPEEQQRTDDALAGQDRQIRTVKDWLEAEENRPETEPQRRQRERRERSKRIIAAVSDGISAISNLYFTSQYAPSMYNPEKGSMTKAVNERLERAKAERKRKRDQYMSYALRLGDLENGRARTVREMEEQQERRKLAREKAQRDAAEHKWKEVLQPDIQREQARKAERAGYESDKARAEAEAAPEFQKVRIETEKAHGDSYKASAANSRASAKAHEREHTREFQAIAANGERKAFSNRQAAMDFERSEGTYDPANWYDDEEKITTVNEDNTDRTKPVTVTSTRTVRTSGGKGAGYGGKGAGY